MIAAVVQVSKLVWKLKTLRLNHSPTIIGFIILLQPPGGENAMVEMNERDSHSIPFKRTSGESKVMIGYERLIGNDWL